MTRLLVRRARRFVVPATVLVAALGVAATAHHAETVASQAQGGGDAAPLPPVPSVDFPVAEPSELESLYHFAAGHPEVVDHVPCFCGCGKSSGHTSVSSCFISHRPTSSTVVWNDHGAHCTVCVSVVRDARDMWSRDLSIEEIRQAIVAKYHKDKMPITPTPEPPPALKTLRRSHVAVH